MQRTETINLNIHLRGLRDAGGLDVLVEECLHELSRLVPISLARVVLERGYQLTPAFRVTAHLAVPGPDIHAAACDHTLLAAWRKLAADLRDQFRRRTSRQRRRLKDRGQWRTESGQLSRNGNLGGR